MDNLNRYADKLILVALIVFLTEMMVRHSLDQAIVQRTLDMLYGSLITLITGGAAGAAASVVRALSNKKDNDPPSPPPAGGAQ